jgi:hypothetical protein
MNQSFRSEWLSETRLAMRCRKVLNCPGTRYRYKVPPTCPIISVLCLDLKFCSPTEAMSTTTVPVYFEESWAILSSIGLINVFFGLMIVGITSLSPISFVPIISGAAGAIANGLCYYAFYADYPKTPTVVAAAFADGAWLVRPLSVLQV